MKVPTGLGIGMDLALASATSILLLFGVLKINKKVLPYLTVPILLMWVHVAGSALQDNNIGPEWAQNHLHNLGAPASAMLFGLIGTQGSINSYIKRTGASIYRATTRALMLGVVKGWTLGVIACIGIEILMVTAMHDDTVRQGYSGATDWIDISAYLIGEALIIINYLRVAPKVLRKTA